MYAVDINLNDLFSSKFEQLKSNTLAGLNSLQDKLKSAFKFDMSGFSTARNSIDQLRQKIDTLTQNRNSATDFGIVKGLNKEISQAQKELQKLETMGTNTNPLTKLKNDAIMAVPALGLVANPIVAGSLALSGATSMAASFEQGMAKINSTLQVSPVELEKLKNQLITLGKTSNVDLAQVPSAFEKIVSAVGDSKKSMEIFESSLKASKAGFTDINIVADAGAAILANYNGMKSDYAMDVLMKTKNLGKAEFGDLAKYMPQILPDAKRLGISFEEMAGSFAYFTSKGISVEQTTTYLKNMMKPLGDPDKIANLERLGVKIFELGENGEKKMRPMTAIATDMNKAFGKMDAVKRLESFKKLEFDMEAGAGFSLLMQDVPKLTDMMKGMSGATGETDKTLQFTGNTIDDFTQASNQFKAIFIQLGDLVLPLVNGALFGITASLEVLKSGFGTVQPLFQWFYDKSNLLIPVIGTLAGMYALWNFNMLASVATIGLLNGITMIFNGILAVTNFLMSINPVMLIVLGIMALGAALVYAYDTFEPFRNVVNSVFGEMSKMVNMVIEDVTWLITKIREGLEWMGVLNKEKRLKDEAEQKTVTEREEARKQDDITKRGEMGMLADNERQKENTKKETSILGTGNKFDAFKNMKEYMTPDEKKTLKGGKDKLSLGTFGVEGDTRQAKNITANINTLGGIQKLEIHVGTTSEITPELKQKLNDAVREALIGSVRDFETMY